MATVRRFEELEIWQRGLNVYKQISVLCQSIRKQQEYRFAEQLKSAAGSIIDNIAEGFERNSRLEFLQSLTIAKGECGELMSQLHRCLHDKYISEEAFNLLYEEINTLLHKIGSFIKYLNGSQIKGLRFKNRTK